MSLGARLLLGVLLSLLLAHALQLFIDLLRGLDAVGVVGLSGVGLRCSIGLGRNGWRNEGLGGLRGLWV